MTISLNTIRRTAVEVLAYSVVDLFPGVQIIEGKVTDIGFHYDFLLEHPLTDEALPLIEERMRGVAKEQIPIETMDMMRENAMDFFKHHKQPLKIDEAANRPENIVQIWKMGTFYDLCYPPFGHDSSDAGMFKIFKIVSNNETGVVRISGTAFANKQDLKYFIKKQEAAKKRDHRILGTEMRLFTEDQENFPGYWSLLPKGAKIREILLNLVHLEDKRRGVHPVLTPRAPNASVFKQHALLFQAEPHSYRELPIRFSEIVEFAQPVKDDDLWGMFRSRSYTIDTEHVFCTQKQVFEEIISFLQFINKTVNIFGFEYHYNLRTRGQKCLGTVERWNRAIDWMVSGLQTAGVEYTISKEGMSGPRLEVRLLDPLGREWVGPSLSIDIISPDQLNLRYQESDGSMQVPAMMTRSVFGPLERFIALLVENFSGVFPLWMAPEQVRILPVSEKYIAYADKVREGLESAGIRVGTDYRQDPLGGRVHSAVQEKCPYMLIVGDKEENSGTVKVRTWKQDNNETVNLESLLAQLQGEIETKEPLQLRSK